MAERGITLIALVITIIVLLVLAGVSLSLAFADNGILKQAQNGVEKHNEADIEEQIKLAYLTYKMTKEGKTTKTEKDFIQEYLQESFNDSGLKVTDVNEIFAVTLSNGKTIYFNSVSGKVVNSYAENLKETIASTNNSPVAENSKYISDGKVAVIPEGYTISNVISEQSIDTGLVINKDGNEWVWIPVSPIDLAAMYTEDSKGWTMSGTEIVTKYKSNGGIISGVARANPGDTSSYREPDTLVGSGNQYDKVQVNYTAAGFTSYLDMATQLRDDYKNMIDSIKKYEGFYVGRYELGGSIEFPKEQNNISVLANKTWYDLYAACKGFEDSSVSSRMIWGCQWDQVCKFIHENGDKKDINNSSTYGNYSKSVKKAGSNSNYKANNIYDMAGNCHEWTQEIQTDKRITRGASAWNDGTKGTSIIVRYGLESTVKKSELSTRAVLYMN